jgi:hypothetical protein
VTLAVADAESITVHKYHEETTRVVGGACFSQQSIEQRPSPASLRSSEAITGGATFTVREALEPSKVMLTAWVVKATVAQTVTVGTLEVATTLSSRVEDGATVWDIHFRPPLVGPQDLDLVVGYGTGCNGHASVEWTYGAQIVADPTA